MIEIRFESDQKVGPLLRSSIAFRGLRSNERLIRIFGKGECVQSERRACHNELGECLYRAVDVRERISCFFPPINGNSWRTFNSFELVSMHSFMHVSRKST